MNEGPAETAQTRIEPQNVGTDPTQSALPEARLSDEAVTAGAISAARSLLGHPSDISTQAGSGAGFNNNAEMQASTVREVSERTVYEGIKERLASARQLLRNGNSMLMGGATNLTVNAVLQMHEGPTWAKVLTGVLGVGATAIGAAQYTFAAKERRSGKDLHDAAHKMGYPSPVDEAGGVLHG